MMLCIYRALIVQLITQLAFYYSTFKSEVDTTHIAVVLLVIHTTEIIFTV